MATVEREEVRTETVEVHICDFCNQEIDGTPVPIAVNPIAYVFTRRRKIDVSRAKPNEERKFIPETEVPAGYDSPPAMAEHMLELSAEETADLCRHCADNLNLGGDDE